jgi:hypothetical protein
MLPAINGDSSTIKLAQYMPGQQRLADRVSGDLECRDLSPLRNGPEPVSSGHA